MYVRVRTCGYATLSRDVMHTKRYGTAPSLSRDSPKIFTLKSTTAQCTVQRALKVVAKTLDRQWGPWVVFDAALRNICDLSSAIYFSHLCPLHISRYPTPGLSPDAVGSANVNGLPTRGMPFQHV